MDIVLDLEAEGEFTLGLVTDIPNTVLFELDMANLGSSTATGLDKATVEATAKVPSQNSSVDGSIALKPKIAFDTTILSMFTRSVFYRLED
jgi:hypothetical protein